MHAVPHSGFPQQSGQIEWTNKYIKRYSKHIVDGKENKVILKTPKKVLKSSRHSYIILNLMNHLQAIIQILQMERHERIGNKDLARLAQLLEPLELKPFSQTARNKQMQLKNQNKHCNSNTKILSKH